MSWASALCYILCCPYQSRAPGRFLSITFSINVPHAYRLTWHQNSAEQRSVTERCQSCAEVASAIRNAHDIMAHWEALLPGRVLTVPYEALVGDQVGFL